VSTTRIEASQSAKLIFLWLFEYRNPYDSNGNLIREYDDRINRAAIPYDSARQLFLEYDNFNSAQMNEETFVPFLNYPVQKHLSYAQKKAIYDSYANVSPNKKFHREFTYSYFSHSFFV